MNETANFLIGLAMGLNLLALGSSRLPTIIGAMAVQGVTLGLMPLVIEPRINWNIALFVMATVAGKGGLLSRGCCGGR